MKKARGTNSKATKCAAIISTCFPDFADDVDFCTELATKVLATQIDGADDLCDPLEDALAGTDDVDAIVTDLFGKLTMSGVVGMTNGMDDSIADTDTRHTISAKKVETVFAKEIKKRARGNHEVPQAARSCTHKWNGSGVPGVRCQICDFETTKSSRNCGHDCGIKLCGSCWWKWKEKLK